MLPNKWSASQPETYIGKELSLFSKAIDWKLYYSQFFKAYLTGDILEVGAGIGSTTATICDGTQQSWTCLEPDPQIFKNLTSQQLPQCCRLINGTIKNLNPKKKFDAIMYIDVLEHIKDHHAETEKVKMLLKQGGKLIILTPAHQWLYSIFDYNIGHYRRYTKRGLKNIIPPDLKCIKLIYLDSVGITLSIANRLILKQKLPNQAQISFWNNTIIPASKVLDKTTNYTIGKSVLGIWHKYLH